MAGDIVNLRQARKSKARAGKERQATENRALHGRTKAERLRDEQAKARIARELDGARRDRATPGEGGGDDGK